MILDDHRLQRGISLLEDRKAEWHTQKTGFSITLSFTELYVSGAELKHCYIISLSLL